MKNFATKAGAKVGLDISAEVKVMSPCTVRLNKIIIIINFPKQDEDEDSDEDDFSDYDLDETALEVYMTPIDDEETDNELIDEYIVFQETIAGKN